MICFVHSYGHTLRGHKRRPFLAAPFVGKCLSLQSFFDSSSRFGTPWHFSAPLLVILLSRRKLCRYAVASSGSGDPKHFLPSSAHPPVRLFLPSNVFLWNKKYTELCLFLVSQRRERLHFDFPLRKRSGMAAAS